VAGFSGKLTFSPRGEEFIEVYQIPNMSHGPMKTTTTATTGQELAAKKCRPCEGGVAKLSPKEIDAQLSSLSGWRLTHDGLRIRKDWVTRGFKAALDFFNRVGELAEEEGHHPDLHLEGYRNVWIEIWTHAIDGLSDSDFILAAKIDRLPIHLKD
jgi:4a-hydroxytetrahydrobiopterin dehydratase